MAEIDNKKDSYVLATKSFYRAARYASRNFLEPHEWVWLETKTDAVVVYVNTKNLESGNPLSDNR